MFLKDMFRIQKHVSTDWEQKSLIFLVDELLVRNDMRAIHVLVKFRGLYCQVMLRVSVQARS